LGSESHLFALQSFGNLGTCSAHLAEDIGVLNGRGILHCLPHKVRPEEVDDSRDWSTTPRLSAIATAASGPLKGPQTLTLGDLRHIGPLSDRTNRKSNNRSVLLLNLGVQSLNGGASS